MYFSSYTWLIMLIVSGVVALVSNTNYPLAKSREEKESLSGQARTILLAELDRNRAQVAFMRQLVKNNNIIFEKLDTAAWATVASGGLLRGLDASEINKFLKLYQLINRANELEQRIEDLSVGIQSTLGSAGTTRQNLFASLKGALEELDQTFETIKPLPKVETNTSAPVKAPDIFTVKQTEVAVFSDRELNRPLANVKGVIIQTTNPEDPSVKMEKIYPSTYTDYEPGDQVTWDWNSKVQYGAAWYRDSVTGNILEAWISSNEFNGRPIK